MMSYTVEVYKRDRRVKTGERLVRKVDHSSDYLPALQAFYGKSWRAADGYRCEFHKTYVERINLMSGLPYQERYDTPYCCSPSSETYWSM